MNLCWRKILVMPVFTFSFCTSFSYIQDILKWTLANKSIHNIISENFLQRKGPIECGWGYDNQNAFKKFLNRPEFSLFCFDHPLALTRVMQTCEGVSNWRPELWWSELNLAMLGIYGRLQLKCWFISKSMPSSALNILLLGTSYKIIYHTFEIW